MPKRHLDIPSLLDEIMRKIQTYKIWASYFKFEEDVVIFAWIYRA